MKENFQIHIWLGLLLCLLGMSCSDDTPAKGDDPGNGNTELEVNEWIESVMRSDYLWNNDIPAQNKLDFSADPQTFFRSMLSLKDGKTRNGKHLYYYSYMVSIRPRACFSPSYNKVKSQTKHVWLLTLL